MADNVHGESAKKCSPVGWRSS